MFVFVDNQKNSDKIEAFLLSNHVLFKKEVIDTTILLQIMSSDIVDDKVFTNFEGVLFIKKDKQQDYLYSRKTHPQDTIIQIKDKTMGGDKICVIAGPCSIENKIQLNEIVKQIHPNYCDIIRAGAYKPRTSPYDFQGLEFEGLQMLNDLRKNHSLLVVSEIMDVADLELFLENVDIIQVGARNMQNFSLLKALGKTNKPILLKRGMGNTIEEWLLSAEYILKEGNNQVILCERGIRTFEKSTRTTLDLSAIPVLKNLTHLPVIVDPSHACGNWEYVEPMAMAAIAAGADGIMVEVHNQPLLAKSDGEQSLKIERYIALIEKCKKIASAIGKEML